MSRKSEIKIEYVKKEYWTCLVNVHRHRTKEVANACIAKFESRGPPRDLMAFAIRNFDIVECWLAGETKAALGRKFSLSTGTTNRVVDHYLRTAMHPEAENRERGHTDRFTWFKNSKRMMLWKPGLTQKLMAGVPLCAVCGLVEHTYAHRGNPPHRYTPPEELK